MGAAVADAANATADAKNTTVRVSLIHIPPQRRECYLNPPSGAGYNLYTSAMLPHDPKEPKPKLVECPACHAKVTKDQLKRIGGRLLCPGCAAAWFQDEDEQEEDEK